MQIGALNSLPSHAAPAKPALPAPVMKKIDETASSFESMFMSQMMQFMWTQNEADETFGGGHGETMWRGMLVQEFGKISSQGDGIGLAKDVRAQMVNLMQTRIHPQDNETTETTQTQEIVQ